jgi:hypothetical protein
MATAADLNIVLTDVADIRSKLPQARDLLNVKRRALIDAQRDLENWKLLVERLEAIAGPDDETKPPSQASTQRRSRAPAQEAVVEALEQAGEPMSPAVLYQFMVEHNMEAKNANAVGANTWQAWKAGRIKKLPDGRYASLTYVPAELLAGDAGGP